MMADPPILSCKSSRNTMYILLTISFIITPSLAQSLNLARNKTVSQSSTLNYSGYLWTAAFAVDGKEPGDEDFDNCQCCSSTNSSSNNYLTLDLGMIYTIHSIYVLARPDRNNGVLQLAKLYISNATQIASSAIYTHSQTTQNFTWNATEVTYARYVKLLQPNDDLLIVCELKVFKRNCPDVKYGPTCTQDCLNCATCNQTDGQCFTCINGTYGAACLQTCPVNCAGSTCDKINGQCNACVDGKYGDTCQDDCSVNCAGPTCKQDGGHCNTCIDRKYGDTCQHDCSVNCVGSTCEQDGGHCNTCIDGKYGDTCQYDCSVNCAGSSCDKINGQCNACVDGKYGNTCQDDCSVNCAGSTCEQDGGHCNTCIDRKYGDTCQYDCSVNCAGSTCEKDSGHCNTCVGGTFGNTCSNNCPPQCEGNVCGRIDGQCSTGCKPGYTGDNCDSPCTDGRYGYNCTATCGHCSEAAKCNKTDGICMTGCLLGYKPGYCTEECNAGQYGFNCANSCGNCSSIRDCNKVNGTCMTGCTSGYQPGLCNQTCTMQTFGVNCNETCHCADGVQCNVENGYCPGGNCTIGFGLQNCTKDVSLLPRLNGTFTTSQSTTYSNWSSTRAVDGKLERDADADSCQCCSTTNATPTDKWWSIDLHQPYLVQYVQIYSRTSKGETQQIQGIHVVIANSTDDSGQVIFNDTSDRGEDVYNIEVIPVRPLQIVKILRNSPESLTLCEVKILEKFCEVGHFGYNCSRMCNCGDNQTCHAVTGHCMSPSCLPGWKGSACEEACQPGSYGANCTLACRCTDFTSCSRYDGSCGWSTCLPGYQETDCQTECDEGFYGQNCTSKCGNCATSPCSFIDGNCTDGCAKGVTGFLCKASLTQDASSSPVVGAAVGSVAAVVILGIIAAVVYVRRSRFNSGRTSTSGNTLHKAENAAFDGDAVKDVHQDPVTDDTYQDLHVYNEPESPYSEINTGSTSHTQQVTADDVNDGGINALYQRLTDIKRETRSVEMEVKKKQLEKEIRQAEMNLSALKLEVDGGDTVTE